MPARSLPPLDTPKIPPIPDAKQGWGLRIEAMLIRAVLTIIANSNINLSGIISWGLKNYLEDFESELIPLVKPLLQEALDRDALPPGFADVVRQALDGKQQAATVVLAGAAIGLMTGGFSQIFGPVWDKYRGVVAMSEKSALIDPSSLVALTFRDPSNYAVWLDHWKRWGYTEKDLDPFQELAIKRLPIGEALRLLRRQPERESQILGELTKQGWIGASLDQALQASLLYPGPDDIIRFAVRDVFKPDVVQTYGYDEDIPDQFETEMSKAGFAPGYAKYYWRAHWNLPSIDNVIDMWRRTRHTDDPDKTDDTILSDYLRINDIPKFWRNRIIGITYQLATRVDIRRFYEMGLWNRERVKQEYYALGYDEEHAETLTRLAEKDAQPATKDITQAAILKAYKDRLYTREQAIQGQIDIGFDQNEAELYINLADFDAQTALQNEEIDRVETLYVGMVIDDVTAQGELGKLNLPAEKTTELFQLWDIRRRKNIKLPTQSELEEFYLNGIITKDDYQKTLEQQNFSADRVQWTLVRADQKLQASAEAKQKIALAEQARLQQDTTANKYARDRQALEVKIAEDNLAIADIKLAIYGVSDADQKQQAANAILQYQDEIKSFQLDMANLKQTFITTTTTGSTSNG